MGQDAAARKKQYVAIAIVVAAVVSGVAILIAVTQQEEESVVIDSNPLLQSSGSQSPTVPGQQEQLAPSVTLSPSASADESRVTVQGTGFVPNERVTVAIEDTVLETMPSAVSADWAGNFLTEATVPALPAGQYEVEATGEAGSLATRPMTIS